MAHIELKNGAISFEELARTNDDSKFITRVHSSIRFRLDEINSKDFDLEKEIKKKIKSNLMEIIKEL